MKMRAMVKLAVAAAMVLGSASAALAWTPTAEAVATAQKGKVWFLVTPDQQSGVQLARGVVDINASPAVVWKVMTDCAAQRRIIPSNRGCRVLEKKPGYEVIEHILKTPLMPNVRSVFRQDEEPQKRIVITRIEGDLKVLSGEYRLTPLPGGGTRVSQEMRMQPGFSAPGPMVRDFLRGEVSNGLANLKREAEAKS
jgi:uncharacterized protein YndB with AHSA1/START domain